MPGMNNAGRAVGTTIRGARATARGGTRAGRWVVRGVGFFRRKGAGGEIGMMRLLDLHAASCAGDTLVMMGLAGTVFFNVSVSEARGRVALYLLITMVPFAILAPVVGPLLDRFRHGRRYALAVTMLGRAFLAWLISDYINGIGLYPAAFGVLALSRAYGVARSAAVPRLLPASLGLSEAGARASIFGTFAGIAVAPLGIAALWVGPQWPLRVSAVIFVIGMVVALRLPPRADSDPPEVLPRVFQLPSSRSAKVLSGKLIVAVLSSSAALRAVYGFLALFLAFAIRSGDLTTNLFGHTLKQTTALGLAVGSLGIGSLIGTMIGAQLRIRRPALLQAVAIIIVALTALFTTVWYSLGLVILLGLAVSIVSGLAKLAVDASIQEQIPEGVRASAFAHSETLLMIAWVVGGGLGLIPFNGRLGIGICAVGMLVAAIRAAGLAVRLRGEKLHGRGSDSDDITGTLPPGADERRTVPARSIDPDAPTRPAGTVAVRPGDQAAVPVAGTDRTVVEKPRRGRWGRTRTPKVSDPAPAAPVPSSGDTSSGSTRVLPRADADQPGYHLYRPSGTATTPEPTSDDA